MKSSLYRILLLACFVWAGVQAKADAQTLTVERRGDYLHMTAPQLQFLSGKALERLHDGDTVHYVTTLKVVSGNHRNTVLKIQEKFAVSYDLWEEKFSVLSAERNGRSASRLSAAMMESWLLGAVTVPIRILPEQSLFHIELECYAEIANGADGEKNSADLTLAGLIDALSRKEKEKPQLWKAATQPLRISDLKNNK